MCDFILPFDDPSEIDPPDLRAGARIAQRLEGNRHFERPPLFRPMGSNVPDGVPALDVYIVGNGLVANGAEGVGLKHDPIALVVERIKDDSEAVILKDILVV